MHPDDVLAYVVAEQQRLEGAIAEHDELGVVAVERHGLELQIRLSKRVRPPLRADVQSRIQVPGAASVTQTFVGVDLAHVEERELLLVMDCHNFDGDPPTAELRQGDGTPLPPNRWPHDLGGQGVIHGHPDYDRPFFCQRGLREYHSHPQHEDDPWDRHREGLPLHRIALELLDQLATRWVLES